MNFGVCIKCGHYGKLNFKHWCGTCVYKQNHGGKTPFEVQLEKQKLKKKFLRKTTGERDLFIEIWNERPHYCENPKCRKWLGNEPKVQFFSHHHSKGSHPELRLCKGNIDLLCEECHHQWDFGTKFSLKFKI